MDAFMVERQPFFKSCIETFKGVSNRLFTIEKTIPDRPEKSLYFSTTTRFSWWSMDEMDTEICADKLEMPACITGPVVGIETQRFAVNPHGGHQLFHEYLGVLRCKKSGTDHISCGVINDGVQIGFALFPVYSDFRAMEEICHPELAKVLVSKWSCRVVLGQVGIPLQVSTPCEPVECCTRGGSHIPELFLYQVLQEA